MSFAHIPIRPSWDSGAPSSLRDMTTSDFHIWHSRFLMKSAPLEDSSTPEGHFDVEAIDNSVGAAADGDKVYPITEVWSISLIS